MPHLDEMNEIFSCGWGMWTELFRRGAGMPDPHIRTGGLMILTHYTAATEGGSAFMAEEGVQ